MQHNGAMSDAQTPGRDASPQRGFRDWGWLVIGVVVLGLAIGIGYPMVQKKREQAAVTPTATVSVLSPTASPTAAPTATTTAAPGMQRGSNKHIDAIAFPESVAEATLVGVTKLSYPTINESASYSGPAGSFLVYRDHSDGGGITASMTERKDFANYRCGLVTGTPTCLTTVDGGHFWVSSQGASMADLQAFMPAFIAKL